MQRTVDLLEQEGFVELVDNPDHQRAKLVKLSESGTEALVELRRADDEFIRQISRGLKQRELEAAARLLRSVRLRIEEIG